MDKSIQGFFCYIFCISTLSITIYYIALLLIVADTYRQRPVLQENYPET